MEESTSKEKVLKKVRNAQIHKPDIPYPSVDFESPIYQEMDDSVDINFAREFTKVMGKFVYCENDEEVIGSLKSIISESGWKNIFCTEIDLQQLLKHGNIDFSSNQEDMQDMDAAVTQCEFLVARTGSIMISSRQFSGRKLIAYPPAHIVVAKSSQLVPDIKHALQGMKEKYGNTLPSLISLVTGPSRTADIEKTLVMGAHGPKELYVFLVESPEEQC